MTKIFSYHGVVMDPPARSFAEAKQRAKEMNPALYAVFAAYNKRVAEKIFAEAKTVSFLHRWLP